MSDENNQIGNIEGTQIMKILKTLQMNNLIDNQRFINLASKVKKYLLIY